MARHLVLASNDNDSLESSFLSRLAVTSEEATPETHGNKR